MLTVAHDANSGAEHLITGAISHNSAVSLTYLPLIDEPVYTAVVLHPFLIAPLAKSPLRAVPLYFITALLHYSLNVS